jgi:hypothetical protein
MSSLFDRLGDIVPEVGAELNRLGKQGQMELANALFNGSAFVPYGPGQYTPTPEMEQAGQEQQMIDSPEIERGGMEM